MKPKPDPEVSLDPSQILRPEKVYDGKPVEAFRDYTIDDTDPIHARVRKFYYDMHTNMTFDFVKAKKEKWLKFKSFKSTIKDALIELNNMLDESDPDVDVPNIVHAFQTAERIRKEHPDQEWFQLVGLIHDLGKVMSMHGEPQWCVTGDTYPMGCKWGKSIVYGEDSFKNNPDTYNPKYNTEYGIYKPKCGIENLEMVWSHDEYIYRFLVHNKSTIPARGLNMIRFHSFYPWHAGGDYKHLMADGDEKILEDVLMFNVYDLYTKSAEIPDIEALWPHYERIIDKYIPGVLEF